jgi:hypothetical protein
MDKTRWIAERFLPRIIRTATCWHWGGYVSSDGYGYILRRGAHRVAYEHFVGPIPDGLQLDHLCRVKHCVNPSHLEAVTRQENMRRAVPFRKPHHSKRRTHCKKGHLYSPDNLYHSRHGYQICRTCTRAYQKEWYASTRL